MPPYEEICPRCGAILVLDAIAMRKRLVLIEEGKGSYKSIERNNLPAEQDSFELECVVKRKTDAAIFVETEDGDEYWIPKSQLVDFDDDQPLKEIESINMSMWIAKQKGFI
jgi:PhoPQ-activated pathogenicity-related protein